MDLARLEKSILGQTHEFFSFFHFWKNPKQTPEPTKQAKTSPQEGGTGSIIHNRIHLKK